MQSRFSGVIGLVSLCVLLLSLGCAHTFSDPTPVPAKRIGNPETVSSIQDIVREITNRSAAIKTFAAVVESQALDPNGGFNKFHDQLTVKGPDKIAVKRTVLVAHNRDAVGRKVTTVVDGTWLVTLDESSGRPNRKVNLRAVEEAGGPSVQETVAMMGNLADPFSPYKQDTLKLESETATQWVILAEYKQEGAPWPQNRLTIDKKTGLLSTVEAILPDIGVPQERAFLLKVLSVDLWAHVTSTAFSISIPSESRVTDDTQMWIANIKAQKQMNAGRATK